MTNAPQDYRIEPPEGLLDLDSKIKIWFDTEPACWVSVEVERVGSNGSERFLEIKPGILTFKEHQVPFTDRTLGSQERRNYRAGKKTRLAVEALRAERHRLSTWLESSQLKPFLQVRAAQDRLKASAAELDLALQELSYRLKLDDMLQQLRKLADALDSQSHLVLQAVGQ